MVGKESHRTDEQEVQSMIDHDPQALHRVVGNESACEAQDKRGFEKRAYSKYKSKMKIIGTILIISGLISASIILYRFEKNIDELSSDKLYGEDNLVPKNIQENRLPQLRSNAKHSRSRQSPTMGHITLYIRKPSTRLGPNEYHRMRIPVARYEHYPIPFKGRLVNYMPWTPIFADRITKHTLVYSSSRKVYIMPALITDDGRLFSIAYLTSVGYASFFSNGARPTSPIDMIRLFQTKILTGSIVPIFDDITGRFKSGFRTGFNSFPAYNSDDEDQDAYHTKIESSIENKDESYSNEHRYNIHGSKGYKSKKKAIKHVKTSKTTVQPYSSTGQPSNNAYLTQCNPLSELTKPSYGIKSGQADIRRYKRLKIPSLSSKLGHDGHAVPNTYMIELKPGANIDNCLKKAENSLKKSKHLKEPEIKQRHKIESELFTGVSLTLPEGHGLDALEMDDEAVDIYPVYAIRRVVPQEGFSVSRRWNTQNNNEILSHELTGVDKVHKKFRNFGRGVKVAVIDSGVDYTHPALGGCFGKGCKVSFGYDHAGDAFEPGKTAPKPDEDPIENCSAYSHGTHVIGVIIANTTGITDPQYIPYANFLGVAPEVTLGAYRVFGCTSPYTDSDLVTDALVRAYKDGADIINLSIGTILPYAISSASLTAERIAKAGVYITVAAGNEGEQGLYMSGEPSIAPGMISVASADNKYKLKFVILAPDGRRILYDLVNPLFRLVSNITSTIVVNDFAPVISDGCSGPMKNVSGAVVLFAYNELDQCTIADRCKKSADMGAIGCLIYNYIIVEELEPIPAGSISTQDALGIIETVKMNPSAKYTFTDFVDRVTMATAETPSSFSSFGLDANLFFKPDIAGIGRFVYSTISSQRASITKSSTAYAMYSGTSFASPYVAGVLALFLASINNPRPNTVNGYSKDGICRPPISAVLSMIQSTSTMMRISGSSLYASTAQQGTGLINAYKALTSTTIFSPSSLALNDTVNRAKVYKVKLINFGTRLASYVLTHQGAALATGMRLNDDQLLRKPIFSRDFAEVTIRPSEFDLEPGESQQITIEFREPSDANPRLLPIFSGFILATNTKNGEITHLSYAGVVGDYSNVRIWVRESPSRVITGAMSMRGNYVTDSEIPVLNATEGISALLVMAWASRYVGVFISLDNGAGPSNPTMSSLNYAIQLGKNIPRNVAPPSTTYRTAYYRSLFNGRVFFQFNGTNGIEFVPIQLPAGRYRMNFAALKHFKRALLDDDWEIYTTPPFDLVY